MNSIMLHLPVYTDSYAPVKISQSAFSQKYGLPCRMLSHGNRHSSPAQFIGPYYSFRLQILTILWRTAMTFMHEISTNKQSPRLSEGIIDPSSISGKSEIMISI